MHTLVKTACALHSLALATSFGAPFVFRALKKSTIKEISDEKQRGRVLACTATRFNRVNVPAHVIFTGTWLIERHAMKKLNLDTHTKRLIGLKDIAIAGALVAGVANVAVFNQLKRDYPDGVPVRLEETTPDAKLARYRAYYRVMGPLHMMFITGSIVLGTLVAGSIIRSEKVSLRKRIG